VVPIGEAIWYVIIPKKNIARTVLKWYFGHVEKRQWSGKELVPQGVSVFMDVFMERKSRHCIFTFRYTRVIGMWLEKIVIKKILISGSPFRGDWYS